VKALPETSAERRFRPFRHSLVRELARRSGPFWDAVAELRAFWPITVSCQVPPGKSGVYLPPDCDSIADVDPYDWSPEACQICEAYETWMTGLYHIHQAIILDEYRIGGGMSGSWSSDISFDHWCRFLSACVLYDPPSDALVAFADASPHGPREWLEPGGPSIVHREALIVPEIRYLRDADHVEEIELWYRDELLSALAKRLEPRGIDVWKHISEIEAGTALYAEYIERYAKIDRQPHIAVFPHTTAKAVTEARNQLLGDEKPKRGRPRRDRLRAEEVARLRSDGLTEAEIASRIGWAVSPDDYHVPRRSSTVRRHLAEASDQETTE